MRASTKRIFSLLGAAAFFVATLSFYSLALMPEYTSVNALRGSLDSKTKIFNEQSKIILKVKDAIAEYQGTSKVQDAISMTLPKSEEASSITGALQAIALVSGAVLQSLNLQSQALRPSQDEQVNGVKALGVVEINARLIGPYEAIKNFLQGVETNIRLMDVVDFRTEAPSKANLAALSHNVTIRAYYQAE